MEVLCQQTSSSIPGPAQSRLSAQSGRGGPRDSCRKLPLTGPYRRDRWMVRSGGKQPFPDLWRHGSEAQGSEHTLKLLANHAQGRYDAAGVGKVSFATRAYTRRGTEVSASDGTGR